MSNVIEDSNHVAGDGTIDCARNEEKELKLCVIFNRHENYKGEYGFDDGKDGLIDERDSDDLYDNPYFKKWKMEFTKSTEEPRLSNFDKSKFPPVRILALDEEIVYNIPWLCVPPAKFIHLSLNIAFIEGVVGADDIIELPKIDLNDESNIGFLPNIIKISDLEETAVGLEVPKEDEGSLNYNTFDLSLYVYIGRLEKHTVIEALDKNGNPIGFLKVFKNSDYEDYKFDITPIRVLRSNQKDSDIEAIRHELGIGFADSSSSYHESLQKLETYLNGNALNQALLHCSFNESSDLIIDETEMILKSLIDENTGALYRKTPLLFDELLSMLNQQHSNIANKRGILLFLFGIEKEGVAGQGNLYDVDAKVLAIYKGGLKRKDTFVHEIAHVLGLDHSFIDSDYSDYSSQREINKMNNYILKSDDECKAIQLDPKYNKYDDVCNWKTLTKKYKQNNLSTSNFTDEEKLFLDLKREQNKKLIEAWNNKSSYRKYRGYLNVYYRNPHKFQKYSSENFMDYDDAHDAENGRESISFWKFQWLALQDDVKKFYNKK